MKKVVLFLALLSSCLTMYSQNTELDSTYVQSYSTEDLLSKYGKALTPDEINAEFVKLNQSILRFKKINNFGYASAIASTGFIIFSLREEDIPRQQTYLTCSAAFGIASFALFFIANIQLDFDQLYITPTGVVYKF